MNQFYRDRPEEKIKNWAHRFDWTTTAKEYLNLYRSM
jgi:hypothetical protein